MSPDSNRLLFLSAATLLIAATTGGSKETHAPAEGTALVQEQSAAHLANLTELQPTNSTRPSQERIGEEAQEAGRAGRKLKRLRRIAVPLLLILLLVKTGLGMPLLMGGVTLAAFKGLWTGSTALAVTAALALRHLLPGPRVIVTGGGGGHHPHYADYVTDYRRADEYRDDYNRYNGYGW